MRSISEALINWDFSRIKDMVFGARTIIIGQAKRQLGKDDARLREMRTVGAPPETTAACSFA